jgi:hypothetical protein
VEPSKRVVSEMVLAGRYHCQALVAMPASRDKATRVLSCLRACRPSVLILTRESIVACRSLRDLLARIHPNACMHAS